MAAMASSSESKHRAVPVFTSISGFTAERFTMAPLGARFPKSTASPPDVYKRQVLELINEYGGKVVDFGEEHLTAEITGTKEKVDSFVEKIRKFGILELSSSGDIAIGIGWDNTLSVAPREAEEDQPEP